VVLVYTGLFLGMILLLAALISEKRNFKKHFEFTYSNFGTHILFISGLAGLFISQRFIILWFAFLLLAGYYIYRQAMKKNSFYFLLVVSLYSYVALSYMIVTMLGKMSIGEMNLIYLGLLYFILSAIALVRLIMAVNRKMKTNDRI
jgi:hypothetical protein